MLLTPGPRRRSWPGEKIQDIVGAKQPPSAHCEALAVGLLFVRWAVFLDRIA